MNPMLLNTMLQMLKAFIPADKAQEIVEKVTPENCQAVIDTFNNTNAKLDLILANQEIIMKSLMPKLELIRSADNVDSNGINGRGEFIAAE